MEALFIRVETCADSGVHEYSGELAVLLVRAGYEVRSTADTQSTVRKKSLPPPAVCRIFHCMELIDSHIHLDFPVFDEDREALLAQAREAGIRRFVVPATTRESWSRIARLAARFSSRSAAFGIHPYFVHQHSLEDCQALDQWLQDRHCVAVGEIGLDYQLNDIERDHQLALFQAQLSVARNHGLPVILHARKAVEEVILQLKAHGLSRGIVHSFNGSTVQAHRLIDLGFKLGFGGALTYPGATRLRAMVKSLPPEAICLETDAPDQATLSFKGERNQPIALLEVLETVADLMDIEPHMLAQQSTNNTYAALNLSLIHI